MRPKVCTAQYVVVMDSSSYLRRSEQQVSGIFISFLRVVRDPFFLEKPLPQNCEYLLSVFSSLHLITRLVVYLMDWRYSIQPNIGYHYAYQAQPYCLLYRC